MLSNSSLLPQASGNHRLGKGPARLNFCNQRPLKLLKDNIKVVLFQLTETASELNSDCRKNLKSHGLVLLFKGYIGSHII